MATPVLFPTKRQKIEQPKKGKSGFGKIGQALGAVGGGIIGGLAGGPGGALAGASTGASLGGLAGETISPTRAGTAGGIVPQSPTVPVPQPQRSAVDRRMTSLSGSSENLELIRGALQALPKFGPDIQQQYAGHLLEGYMVEKQKIMGA
jgi:hypothetical protein